MTVNDLIEKLKEAQKKGKGNYTVCVYDDITPFTKQSDLIIRSTSDSKFVFVMQG